MTNIILNTDSYKASHFLQYPENTTNVSSYIEARGAKDPDFRRVVVFGIQMFIEKYLTKPITMQDVEEAKELFEAHGEPFNYEGWQRIVTLWNGYLPIEIEALPEGTVAPLSVPLVQVKNTDPECAWLTSYVETALLRAIWYPTTVATLSWTIKQYFKEYAEKSGSVEGVDFKLHDFGARGVSSEESAGIGGAAHLINFMGTDTISGILYAKKYYNESMAGFSIPAAEHSTITSWGEDNEVEAYENMLKQFAHPGSLLAVVSDSYDIWNAVDTIWGMDLKQKVLDSGATVVIRPDSGDPTTVPIQVIKRLMDKYGFSTNEKGYKTLPKNIRVIQGDGINKDSIRQILRNLEKEKLTLDNLAFGMGGGLLQQVNRDTLQFAMKANAIKIDGEWRDVYKKPVTDAGKTSKAGIQSVFYSGNRLYAGRLDEQTALVNELKVVFMNGNVIGKTTFSEIRERSNR